jgi:hypothetical protein
MAIYEPKKIAYVTTYQLLLTKIATFSGINSVGTREWL